MSNNIFLEGEEINLLQMLESRDNRQKKQMGLLKKYTNKTLICITMNIPGQIKVTEELSHCFSLLFSQALLDWEESIIHQEKLGLRTGWEGYLVVDKEPKTVKKRLIEQEESFPLGRLFDLDVLVIKEEELVILSRSDFKLPGRKCFICQNTAKECGRNRNHSVEELQLSISSYIKERKDMLNDQRS